MLFILQQRQFPEQEISIETMAKVPFFVPRAVKLQCCQSLFHKEILRANTKTFLTFRDSSIKAVLRFSWQKVLSSNVCACTLEDMKKGHLHLDDDKSYQMTKLIC